MRLGAAPKARISGRPDVSLHQENEVAGEIDANLGDPQGVFEDDKGTPRRRLSGPLETIVERGMLILLQGRLAGLLDDHLLEPPSGALPQVSPGNPTPRLEERLETGDACERDDPNDHLPPLGGAGRRPGDHVEEALGDEELRRRDQALDHRERDVDSDGQRALLPQKPHKPADPLGASGRSPLFLGCWLHRFTPVDLRLENRWQARYTLRANDLYTNYMEVAG